MLYRPLFPLALALSALGSHCVVAASLAVGDRHPDFTLPDYTTGKPVSLADYRGQKVLLIQFASW